MSQPSAHTTSDVTNREAMSTASDPLPVVLAGARGHGRSHLLNIRRLEHDVDPDDAPLLDRNLERAGIRAVEGTRGAHG